MRRSVPAAMLAALALAVPTAAGASTTDDATLLGRAVLPATTFSAGAAVRRVPRHGPDQRRAVPFPASRSRASPRTACPHGGYWVMPDNGYGALENSADFYLRVYHLPPPRDPTGVPGRPSMSFSSPAADPNHRVPFTIVNSFSPPGAHRRRLRHRVAAARRMMGASGSGTSSGRSSSTSPPPAGCSTRRTAAGPGPPRPGGARPAEPVQRGASALRVMNAMRADEARGARRRRSSPPMPTCWPTATRRTPTTKRLKRLPDPA